MRLATSAQTKEIDRRAQAERGLSAEAMTEAAGAVAAREIAQAFLPEILSGAGVAVVCGPGGNGADGLVCARHLRSAGVRPVAAVLCAPEAKRTQLFRLQLRRALDGDVSARDALADASAWDEVRRAGLAVDAVLGVGLSGPLRSPYDRAVSELNARRAQTTAAAAVGRRKPVVSLDAPTGLDCDRGVAAGGRVGEGLAVRADMTICFGLSRPGFYLSDGPSFVGRLRRVSIGVPQSLAREAADSVFAFGESEARASLPRRKSSSNKSTHGRALILAGSARPDGRATWGAGLLASVAAYRAGAGYVTWASWRDPAEAIAPGPEVLTAAIDEAVLASAESSAVAIGPGLGADERAADAVRRLKDLRAEKVLIDADALTAAARAGLFPLPSTWVASPHAGELGRILQAEARLIESDRLAFASRAADVLGCRVLLKGFRTVIAQPAAAGGRRTVVLAGNASLAKAGTGDVLAGAIAGLWAQGLDVDRAAALGAWAHGQTADAWTRSGRGTGSMTASDVCEALPLALGSLERGRAFARQAGAAGGGGFA